MAKEKAPFQASIMQNLTQLRTRDSLDSPGRPQIFPKVYKFYLHGFSVPSRGKRFGGCEKNTSFQEAYGVRRGQSVQDHSTRKGEGRRGGRGSEAGKESGKINDSGSRLWCLAQQSKAIRSWARSPSIVHIYSGRKCCNFIDYSVDGGRQPRLGC